VTAVTTRLGGELRIFHFSGLDRVSLILNQAVTLACIRAYSDAPDREVTDMAAVKESNDKARLVGINHVALEVGSIDEALSFYGQLFELSLRGRSGKMAFIDIGDQFINLSESRTRGLDKERHFGLVVDDKEKVKRRLSKAGVETLPGRGVRVQGSVGKPGSNRGVLRISSSPSTRRCSKVWVVRTSANRPQRSRSSPGKESRLRKAEAGADAGGHWTNGRLRKPYKRQESHGRSRTSSTALHRITLSGLTTVIAELERRIQPNARFSRS